MYMMHHFTKSFSLSLLMCGLCASELEQKFVHPPDSARPGVYWYFMDGNQNRSEMVEELKAMKKVGIGKVLYLEVNKNIPIGPVRFMSEEWQNNLAHVFVEAGKLGMEVMLGTGPGWAGSGGPWVKPEDSMQNLVGSSIQVSGPGIVNQVLPVPPPPKANKYAGTTKNMETLRLQWFRDVAVLAFPNSPDGVVSVDNQDLKTLKDVPPLPNRFVGRNILIKPEYNEPPSSRVIDKRKITAVQL